MYWEIPSVVGGPEVLLPNVGPGDATDEDSGRGQPRGRTDEGSRGRHGGPHEEEEDVDDGDPNVYELYYDGASVVRVEAFNVEVLQWGALSLHHVVLFPVKRHWYEL